jgi:hypothetical protein
MGREAGREIVQSPGSGTLKLWDVKGPSLSERPRGHSQFFSTSMNYKMENQNAAQQLLDFMNLADVLLIAGLPGADGKPLGEALAKRIMEARVKASKTGFTDLKDLAVIKGLGEAGVKELVNRFAMERPYHGKLRSRTLFTFAKDAPKLPEYGDDVILELIVRYELDEKGELKPAGDENTYAVYYAPAVDVTQLFKALRASKNYRTDVLEHTFAIQTRNNQFVAAVVPGSSVYLRDMYFASKFKLFYHAAYEHMPIMASPNYPNAKATVGIETNFYGNQGRLSFSTSQNRVGSVQVQGNPAPTVAQKFDLAGIIGEPWPGAHPLFKNFTMMPFIQMYIQTGADPREFIAGDPVAGSQNGLVGSNNKTESWQRDFQLRYVEVVEDVLLESILNPSHSGTDRWYVNCKHDASNGYAGAINAIRVPTWATAPASARFDMFVFYGYWEERGNIACRVAFRSKNSNKFVGLIPSGGGIAEGLNALHTTLDSNTSFYVENGWGGTVNHLNLKTATGKYVICWQDIVSADSVCPINSEQFQVIIP